MLQIVCNNCINAAFNRTETKLNSMTHFSQNRKKVQKTFDHPQPKPGPLLFTRRVTPSACDPLRVSNRVTCSSNLITVIFHVKLYPLHCTYCLALCKLWIVLFILPDFE
ncbi:hypothetical protein K501DRAFT_267549 [Backusella circina FSU 941]|nr:hypothetical protein K501DRAFT_267549 [Backusella circina FSU 941]